MKSSINAINLIKDSEKFESHPYLCPAGIPTIGYGTTIYENGTHVKLSDAPITKERATDIMFHQLIGYENAVNRYVKVPLNQNQFDALVDFAYNAGVGSFQKSTLLKKLNAGDYSGAAEQFKRWIFADGVPLHGLEIRRAKEKALFLKDMA